MGASKSIEERFWPKVNKEGRIVRPELGHCWEWMGITAKATGYGVVSYKRAPTNTHRVAYELAYGSIPEGQVVRHACDNRLCCNPAHLSLGSHRDNARDRKEHGAHPQGSLIGNSKLSRQDIEDILRDDRSNKLIAADYGVSQSHVSRIKRGATWQHLGLLISSDDTARSRHIASKLTPEQVLSIRNDTRSGSVIAAEYGITRGHANAIKRGVAWDCLETIRKEVA